MPKSSLTLSSSVRYLKGVGPRKEKLLNSLGIHSVADLIFITPRTWENRRISKDFLGAQIEHRAFAVRILNTKEESRAHGRFVVFQAEAACDHPQAPRLSLLWIRRRSRFDVFGKLRLEIRPGAAVFIWGKIEPPRAGSAGNPEVSIEDYEILHQGLWPAGSPHWNRLAPVYSSTTGLAQRELRRWRFEALDLWRQARVWSWPQELRPLLPQGVNNAAWAYEKIHFPETLDEKSRARRSLAFWEMTLLGLAMEQRRQKLMAIKKNWPLTEAGSGSALFNRLLLGLGFSLTESQRRAIDEILQDMGRLNPMNRLLQGEVGSGKTLVALAALCHAVSAGYQCAFVAPTEILVFQHAMNFRRLLEPLGIRVGSLTSDTPAKEREEILEELAGGALLVVVGTHSLLEPEVSFQRLALIVIDEQHRFGVDQRSMLRRKTVTPDCLVLTATPIPRTLALALYGDLDVTTMEELPLGRTLAKIHLARSEQEAWTALQECLALGQQAFVVVPAIEDEDQGDNLTKVLIRLRQMLPGISIASVHGRMSGRDKEEALLTFHRAQAQVLAATTVIEVGIDVPRAAVMIVLSAERFGLATLHQLRGRVGRGESRGLCVLVPSSEALNHSRGPEGELLFTNGSIFQNGIASESIMRLRRFSGCRNGFDVGLLDLELRGPGDLLGKEQHGNFSIRHFDWSGDQDLIAPARGMAQAILSRDPSLGCEPALRHAVELRYGTNYAMNELS
ncbi:MAG: ATP-dependent DNA helicase RecG [Elusimicrobia bacterium]|nr:ATP-dependent DNA helicase RecG [Elusimicrobiota bacterium]